VEFPQAPAGKDTGPKGSLDVLLDVNVPMNVVIGGAEVPVRRLLQLGPGSVITLDKSVDDPVELYLKGSKFATADIVVVEDKFAVRIKEILSVNNSAPKEDKK
jgi:flagellar motor switch protein FliN/FliY